MSAASAATNRELVREVLRAAVDAKAPAPTRQEICDATGLNPSMVTRQLLLLQERGELPCEPSGRALRRRPRTLTPELTPAQGRVLACIGRYLAMNGVAPTLREICDENGFSSTKAALDHVRALERKGKIAHEHGVPRGIRLVGTACPVPLSLVERALGFAYRQHLGQPSEGGERRLRESLRELVTVWPDFARRVGAL